MIALMPFLPIAAADPEDKNQANKLANQVLTTTISALITYGNVLTKVHKEARYSTERLPKFCHTHPMKMNI